jgi:putative ABC transport system ATP-binding protein
VVIFGMCAAAFAIVVLAFLAQGEALRRLVCASEGALMELRIRGFEHIHRLSIATQASEKRGVFVARVTADVDTLQQSWRRPRWFWSA